MVLNKFLLFAFLITFLSACAGEQNSEVKTVSNTKVETVSTKTVETEGDSKVTKVTHKSNEVLAKERIEKKNEEIVEVQNIVETKKEQETVREVVEKKVIKKKDKAVFKIDATDPLPLQFTSHKIADDYRDKEWNPKEGKYYFSELWEFNYKNELLSKNDFGYQGKFLLYLDAKTGTILVDNSQRDMISDEMTDFVIIHSDGRCFEGYTDVHGEKGLKQSGIGIRQILTDSKNIEKTFKEKLVPLGEEKEYGNTKNLKLKGRSYEMSFLKTNDKSKVNLARLPMSALPLYVMNKARKEGKLPIAFDFSKTLPSNFWVLEEHYEVKGKEVSFELANIGVTTHFVDINDYK